MKHPTKRKQLAKSGEVLGTKNGRNKSIEGHKKIRVTIIIIIIIRIHSLLLSFLMIFFN